MTDQELLQAIGQVVETKMDPMRQDIQGIKEDIQGVKEDIRKLDQRVGALEQQVGALGQQVRTLDQRVGTLEEQMTGVRVYLDTDLRRTLNLLLEGQKAVWDRATPPERYDELEVRTSALELAVKQHSQEIQDLKLA